jgi:NADH-quinone oxidoreductase subunit L
VLHAAPVFLPLIGALIAGFFGRFLGDRGSQLVTCGAMVLAADHRRLHRLDVRCSAMAATCEVASWIILRLLRVALGHPLDTLSATMIAWFTLVSCMIHVYSIGYMRMTRRCRGSWPI